MQKEELLRRKLTMNANRRGLLEAELVLGRYLTEQGQDLSYDKLKNLEKIMALEDLDLWEILCARRPCPNDLDSKIVEQLRRGLPVNPDE